jgi:hypothetical protein
MKAGIALAGMAAAGLFDDHPPTAYRLMPSLIDPDVLIPRFSRGPAVGQTGKPKNEKRAAKNKAARRARKINRR